MARPQHAQHASLLLTTGGSRYRGWNLEGRTPLHVKAGQHVIVDCADNDFAMDDPLGKLTMDEDSKLQYVNCHLLNYEFPDTKHVYETVHVITNSTFGMESCRVRTHPSSASAAATAPSPPAMHAEPRVPSHIPKAVSSSVTR